MFCPGCKCGDPAALSWVEPAGDRGPLRPQGWTLRLARGPRDPGAPQTPMGPWGLWVEQQEHEGPSGRAGSWTRPGPAAAWGGCSLGSARWGLSPSAGPPSSFPELFPQEAHLLAMVGSSCLQFFAHVSSCLLGEVVDLTHGVQLSPHDEQFLLGLQAARFLLEQSSVKLHPMAVM